MHNYHHAIASKRVVTETLIMIYLLISFCLYSCFTVTQEYKIKNTKISNSDKVNGENYSSSNKKFLANQVFKKPRKYIVSQASLIGKKKQLTRGPFEQKRENKQPTRKTINFDVPNNKELKNLKPSENTILQSNTKGVWTRFGILKNESENISNMRKFNEKRHLMTNQLYPEQIRKNRNTNLFKFPKLYTTSMKKLYIVHKIIDSRVKINILMDNKSYVNMAKEFKHNSNMKNKFNVVNTIHTNVVNSTWDRFSGTVSEIFKIEQKIDPSLKYTIKNNSKAKILKISSLAKRNGKMVNRKREKDQASSAFKKRTLENHLLLNNSWPTLVNKITRYNMSELQKIYKPKTYTTGRKNGAFLKEGMLGNPRDASLLKMDNGKNYTFMLPSIEYKIRILFYYHPAPSGIAVGFIALVIVSLFAAAVYFFHKNCSKFSTKVFNNWSYERVLQKE